MLTPVHCLPLGPGTPQTGRTSATILTTVAPVPAPHAPTNTDATSQDAIPPTLAKTTPNSPAAERTTLNHLWALAIPPAATPEYLARLSPPTPINIPKLASYLHDHPHQPFVHHLLAGFSEGFKIGYTGPQAPQEFPNLPSAKDNPSVIDRNMLKEVSFGHTAGPFLFPPFANFQVCPIGAIPKKHSSEWRTIFHLSYPKHRLTSVNAHIPPEDYSLQYIKVDNAIAILQDLGQNCFMSKLDIKVAFRNIPVHPLHILDDFFIAAAPPQTHCATALCNVLHLFTEFDIPIAPGKTFPPSTSLEFMGILLDSSTMEARLPQDKLAHTKQALHQWSLKKSTTLRELQSLIGTLQFACRAIAPGRPFLQRIIHLTRGTQLLHWHIKLNAGFRKDIKMLVDFLEHWNGVSSFLDSQVSNPHDLQLFTDAPMTSNFSQMPLGP